MSGALPDFIEERQHPDKKLFVSAATKIPLHKRHIFVTGGSPSYVVTLPDAADANHRKFVISAAAATSGSPVHVVNALGQGTTSIATTGVEVEFESIGLDWIITRGA